MPARMTSYNAVGAYDSTAANKVRLPDLIKCCRCHKKKPHASYSNNRLEDLRTYMSKKPRYDPDRDEHVPCRMCTGGQVIELQCCICDKWMGLDKFAKVYRRTPDKAKCFVCKEEQGNVEPGGRESDEDSGSGSGGSSDDSSHIYGSDDGRSTSTGLNSTLDPSTASGGVAVTGHSNVSSTGAGTIYGGSTTNSRASFTQPSFAGVDQNKYSNLTGRGRPATSTTDSVGTTASNKSGGWAKPKNPNGKHMAGEQADLDDDITVDSDQDSDDDEIRTW